MFFLLLEFNSTRKLGIILMTVPLAAIGVLPGLAITGQPFGFMSMLGVIALIGIVVNNAIVLIDRMESNRHTGLSVTEAIIEGVGTRMRPILLTTATTIAGMLPLAFSGSSLWPPLAWAMISGLLASTALTLVVVPASYQLFFGIDQWPRLGGLRSKAKPVAAVGLVLLLINILNAAPALSAEHSVTEVMDMAAKAPGAQAQQHLATAASRRATTAWLDSLTPTIAAQGEAQFLTDPLAISTPIGDFVQQPEQVSQFSARLTQPLLLPNAWALARSADLDANAKQASADRNQELIAQQAANLAFNALIIKAQASALTAQQTALTQVLTKAEDLFDQGLATAADKAQAQAAVSGVQAQVSVLSAQANALEQQLTALVNADEPISVQMSELSHASLAVSKRTDQQAANWTAKASSAQRTAAAAKLLPNVGASVGWQATSNDSLTQNNWWDASIQATWTFGAGRLTEISQSGAQQAAAKAAAQGLAAQIAAEQNSTAKMLIAREEAVTATDQALTHAQQSAQILDDRYGAQLVDISEVLAAQAALASAKASRDIAIIERQRAQIAKATAGQ